MTGQQAESLITPVHSNRMRAQVSRARSDLQQLYDRAIQSDQAYRADIMSYTCLRMAGYLEQLIELMTTDFCMKSSWGAAREFAISHAAEVPNLTPDRMRRLLKRFGNSFADRFDTWASQDQNESTLKALIGVRNNIAHGQSQSVGIDTLKGYKKMLESLDGLITGLFDEELRTISESKIENS